MSISQIDLAKVATKENDLHYDFKKKFVKGYDLNAGFKSTRGQVETSKE